MQFKVPQFLDIEDKIFGPFTFRQFVYLAGGAGICFVFYRVLGFTWGFIPIAVVAAFALALAFYRPNSKPFVQMVEAVFKYITQNKLYIWKKREVEKVAGKENRQTFTMAPNPLAASSRLTGDKLRDLAWSLDVLDLKKGKESGEGK